MTDPAPIRTALVSDVLDALGHRAQCLGPELSPLARGQVLVGRAFPVTVERVTSVPEVPYVGLLRALDHLQKDDIYVISTEGARDVALWGELLSTIAIARGAVGAICDGYVRDAANVLELGFPVFSRGTVPQDINGRYEVVGHGKPITIEGVRIQCGDLIVGDDDGVCVVPQALEAEVTELAAVKAVSEDAFRRDVAAGTLPSVAYERHGVL